MRTALVDMINKLEDHAPDLKILEYGILQDIKFRAIKGVDTGVIESPQHLAQFVVMALKKEKEKMTMTPKTKVLPNYWNDPSTALQDPNPFAQYGISPAMLGKSPPPPWAGKVGLSLYDEWVKEFFNGSQADDDTFISNTPTGQRDFSFTEVMAEIADRAGLDKLLAPNDTIYDYLKSYCNNFVRNPCEGAKEVACFAAGFLNNLHYIANDVGCNSIEKLIKIARQELNTESTREEFNITSSESEFYKMMTPYYSEEVARILDLPYNPKRAVKPMTNIITTNNGGALPNLNQEILDKLDAMATLTMGNQAVRISDIYNNARGFSQEIAQLKKEIDDAKGQQPIGIKAATGQAGTIHMDWHDRLVTDVKLGRTIAVRGPAGNGKSTGVKAGLESLGYNIYHLDCTDSTTVDQLVGGLEPVPDGKGGLEMKFKDGIFTKAFQDEKGAIQLDEFDALDPRVTMALQSALHRAAIGKNRTVSCPDHPLGSVVAVGDCPVVVTMNTWGTGATREYVGRNAIDAASLDRFDTIINTDYQKENEMLEAIGMKKSDIFNLMAEIKRLRKMINEKGLRIVLSTRRVLNIAEAVLRLDCNVPTAVSREFVERLDDYDMSALGLGKI